MNAPLTLALALATAVAPAFVHAPDDAPVAPPAPSTTCESSLP